MFFMGNVCQSCGMPLSKDINGGGSEKNGIKSLEYCSHCYQNGEFVHPYLTLDQMKNKVQNKMSEMGIPKFLSYFFTRTIKKLKRWQHQ
jgi:hypothetical protein